MRLKLPFTPVIFYYQKIAKKRVLLCLHPVKLFLNFGNSADPNPKNYLGTLMLYGTQGSVRGLNR